MRITKKCIKNESIYFSVFPDWCYSFTVPGSNKTCRQTFRKTGFRQKLKVTTKVVATVAETEMERREEEFLAQLFSFCLPLMLSPLLFYSYFSTIWNTGQVVTVLYESLKKCKSHYHRKQPNGCYIYKILKIFST